MTNINRLDATSRHFSRELDALLSRETDTGAAVQQTVADIIGDVHQRGDTALCEYTRKFDGWNCTPAPVSVSREFCNPKVAH